MSLEVSSATRTASDLGLYTVLTHVRPYQSYAIHASVACAVIWILFRRLRTSRQHLSTTQLRGPPSESFFFGVSKHILTSEDSGAMYEAWAQEYGPVYTVPSPLGSKRIVLRDPKAMAHFYAKDTWSYTQTPFAKIALANLFGNGLSWAEGDLHKRQRKFLTPAFSTAAIRHLTSFAYDSAYKAKAAWDILIESSGEDSAIIDVQKWMDYISLDTIGLAGFSHNFGTLEGKHADIIEVCDTFRAPSRSTPLGNSFLLLAEVFPALVQIPVSRMQHFRKLGETMGEISDVLHARTQKELEMGVVGGKEERSIIGLLIKGASGNSEVPLTKDEVVAQMRLLLLAGYETTSITLTWALLELSRNPDVQTILRNELIEHAADPTYDQLTDGLPYLDAVVHEVLRLHPPVVELTRIANEDDVIPLSEPIHTKSGKLVDSLTIAKGTFIVISMESINRSTAIWGEDAKLFRPSRWLEDPNGQDRIPTKAKEFQGHRHLLTFADGPRVCLGKNFALMELKAILTVLVKNFVFELHDGVDPSIEIWKGLLSRPGIAGETECKLPLSVRPYVA